MLQGVLTQHQGGKSYFVDRKGRFNTDPVNPTFMNALKQDAEITGAITEGTFKHMDAYDKFHAENTEQVHELGYRGGYKQGVGSSRSGHRAAGFVDGILHGWGDAATFKDPLRLYDMDTGGKTLGQAAVPLAKGVDINTLSADITENTTANRPWKKKNGTVNLAAWEKLQKRPFAYNEDTHRMSVDLARFMAGEPNDPLKGFEMHLIDDSHGRIYNSQPKPIKQTRDRVIARMLGKDVSEPDMTPSNIPPRGETTLERGMRDAEEQLMAENEAKRKAEKVERKARKARTITEKVEPPQVEEVETPQATPQKPKTTKKRSKSHRDVPTLEPVELKLSTPPSEKDEVEELVGAIETEPAPSPEKTKDKGKKKAKRYAK